MRSFLFFAALLAAVSLCLSEFRPPPFWQRTREPPPPIIARDANSRAIHTEWIGVPLDHFTNEHTPHFGMRYMTNDQFFVEDGSPIFMMVGGEWSINAGWLLGGHMFQIARDVGGYLVYTEHRYYGLSWPASSTATENLKYLIVDQALADVVDVIKSMKRQPRFAQSKIIIFGGSYAGNMAQWLRDKYPEYIDGALASSGPILAKADYYEYLETVGDALRDYGGDECYDAIKDGVEESKAAIDTGDIDPVQSAFNLCSPLNHTVELDVQTFFSYITGTFSGSVQYGTPASLLSVCNQLLNFSGTPMQRLGAYISNTFGGRCYDTRYQDTIDYYQDTSFGNENLYTTRLWIYQTCTEYGYYQTTNSTNQPFGDTLPVSYYADNLCAGFFGPEFNATVLEDGVNRTNIVYGGLSGNNVTKVFTVHGSIDPWHRLGVLVDINNESPTVFINGTAHCVDLQSPSSFDIPELTEARNLIRQSVMEWISS